MSIYLQLQINNSIWIIQEYLKMLHKVMKFNLNKIYFVQNVYQTCCYCATSSINHDILTFFQQNLGIYFTLYFTYNNSVNLLLLGWNRGWLCGSRSQCWGEKKELPKIFYLNAIIFFFFFVTVKFLLTLKIFFTSSRHL